MAPTNHKWDAYQTLDITNRYDYGMTCVGRNRYGKRCRWDISDDKYQRVRTILDGLETKAPSEAPTSFTRLAQLSLCEDWHQNQAYNKIREWTAAIQDAAQFYDSSSELEERIEELEALLEKETEKKRNVEQELKAASERIHSLNIHSIQQDSALRKAQSDVATELEARKRAEKEAKENEERFRKIVFEYETLKIKFNERIQQLRDRKRKESEKITKTEEALEQSQRAFREKNQELQKLLAKAEWQTKEMKTMSLDLEELDESETTLLAQKFDLTYELEKERHRIVTIESNLGAATSERDLALGEKQRLMSQLDSLVSLIEGQKQSLLELNSGKNMLLEELEGLKSQLATEMEKVRCLDVEKSQTATRYAALAESMKTTIAEITAEKGLVRELQKNLTESSENLSNAQSQLGIAKEDSSRSKAELELVRAELAEIKGQVEEVHQTASNKEGEMLARIEALMQERGYANGHPFRVFFRQLKRKVTRRGKLEELQAI